MKNRPNSKLLLELHRLLMTILGLMLLGLSINLLSWQFKLVSSGMPGYGLAINYLTGISVGKFLLLANTAILLIAFVAAGKGVGVRGVFGYIFLAVFIDLSRNLLGLEQIEISSFATNTMIIGLQGLVAPIGIALVISHGYSFGSYSSMLPIVQKFRKIYPPTFFFVLDLILVFITLFFFGLERSLLLLINAVIFMVSFKYFLSLFQMNISNIERINPSLKL